MSPNDTWNNFAPNYSLVEPNERDIDNLLQQQQSFFRGLRSTWTHPDRSLPLGGAVNRGDEAPEILPDTSLLV